MTTIKEISFKDYHITKTKKPGENLYRIASISYTLKSLQRLLRAGYERVVISYQKKPVSDADWNLRELIHQIEQTLLFNEDEIEFVEFVELGDIKKGEFFKRIIGGRMSKEVYTKGDYDRSYRRYSCDLESDISRDVMLKGSTIVLVGFTY